MLKRLCKSCLKFNDFPWGGLSWHECGNLNECECQGRHFELVEDTVGNETGQALSGGQPQP